jgi:hypothetical protein
MTDIAADCKRGCGVAGPHACCVAQIATTNFALKSMSIQCVGGLPNRLSCDFSTYPQVQSDANVTAPIAIRITVRLRSIAVEQVKAWRPKSDRACHYAGECAAVEPSHIDFIHQPCPEEPTEGRRPEALEGRRTAAGEAVRVAILRDAVLRTAPQDEVVVSNYPSRSD